ncbi:hypothetical protein B4098_2688 [Heyndrickxia coagulans]|uniref:Uncharacterized protein n=1 Tax=Heyndrickxia coagulans TaxID=1398 RepID=A0A150JQH7_HEYCO|nr:hypothetical protein HMPREF3213_00892 [Heyndrickxia coagulans]KYC59446.1 hypothetical protein B4098_2688 [Heyndrickxia coagulans]KYC64975.1 hypothetical protein B4100_2853 [Heyndrickxia coagulans]KYC73856.1 hypothetical protein B4099_2817 [Heyndrickxia coagulans]
MNAAPEEDEKQPAPFFRIGAKRQSRQTIFHEGGCVVWPG